MSVNTSLAGLSDNTFQAAFLVYAVALVASLFYYVKMQPIIRLRRLVAQDPSVKNPSEGDMTLSEREEKARKWAGATQALVWTGLILHVISAVTRGLSAGRFPLGNLYEYVLMISCITLVVAAFVIQRRGQQVVWPWILTPLLVLMFVGATKLYADSAPVVPALQSYWLPVHVTTVSTGASIGIVSGVFSLLYLLRVGQAPGKEAEGGIAGVFGAMARPLPTADKLDAIAYKLAVFTLPILGMGIIFGAIWAEDAWTRFWGWDPKETFSFISWILYAAYLHARATAGWKVGAAWVNILAMSTMVFNLLFINLVVSGLHSYAGLN
ncbi:c-type cytochrome biogenesis protein CcsB [Corynebacterium lowii]|uniref:Cytochrome c biogenesis protein CcsA n=1 Tax=Corynebacterium lowii TaxID=1544413 RepID=A0A0Q1E3P2_9CORY|nr:c-type cytochrome biogenesis protein CcsB [Corynebacterium lowii]KQB87329.1 Cytochrome c biogenesis protein CcsA [Corynebacterium lowii]MDP9852083.1 cytochrome c-type biogenesis protein CcsB [Corynebacterium lowii]